MYLMYLSVCGPEINPFGNWMRILLFTIFFAFHFHNLIKALLPERYDSILYFKEDEVKLLEGSIVYDKALKIRERAKSSFEQVKELFKAQIFIYSFLPQGNN